MSIPSGVPCNRFRTSGIKLFQSTGQCFAFIPYSHTFHRWSFFRTRNSSRKLPTYASRETKLMNRVLHLTVRSDWPNSTSFISENKTTVQYSVISLSSTALAAKCLKIICVNKASKLILYLKANLQMWDWLRSLSREKCHTQEQQVYLLGNWRMATWPGCLYTDMLEWEMLAH